MISRIDKFITDYSFKTISCQFMDQLDNEINKKLCSTNINETI